MFPKILVGYDGSKGAKAALECAAVMARDYKAEITALWVREPLPRHSDLPGEFEGEEEAAEEYFQERRKEVEAVAAEMDVTIPCEKRRGHAAKTLVKAAADGCYDLIVVGHS